MLQRKNENSTHVDKVNEVNEVNEVNDIDEVNEVNDIDEANAGEAIELKDSDKGEVIIDVCTCYYYHCQHMYNTEEDENDHQQNGSKKVHKNSFETARGSRGSRGSCGSHHAAEYRRSESESGSKSESAEVEMKQDEEHEETEHTVLQSRSRGGCDTLVFETFHTSGKRVVGKRSSMADSRWLRERAAYKALESVISTMKSPMEESRLVRVLYICDDHQQFWFEKLEPPNWHLIRQTEQDTKQVMRDLLTGLQQSHQANVAHCDIKPDAIMRRPTNTKGGGPYVLMDFDGSINCASQRPIEHRDLFTATWWPYDGNKGLNSLFEIDVRSAGIVLLWMMGGWAASTIERGGKSVAQLQKTAKISADSCFPGMSDLAIKLIGCELTLSDALHHPFLQTN